MVMLESNIDDMNPQIYDVVIERLLTGGALDVTLTPVIMKQGRPGIILGVLAKQEHLDYSDRNYLSGDDDLRSPVSRSRPSNPFAQCNHGNNEVRPRFREGCDAKRRYNTPIG